MVFANHHRQSIRLPGYDYRDGGMYFVTICTQNRKPIFGNVRNNIVGLSDIGCIVAQELQNTEIIRPYVTMDTWIIMPNHIHMIAWIHPLDCPCCRMNINDHGRGVACNAPTYYDIGSQLTGPSSQSLGAIIRGFKSACTKQINLQRDASMTNIIPRTGVGRGVARYAPTCGPTIWQRNYYEHIIRSENERLRIRRYIMNNPAQWNAHPDVRA